MDNSCMTPTGSFYELMQAYRLSPITDQVGTHEKYLAVWDYFRIILKSNDEWKQMALAEQELKSSLGKQREELRAHVEAMAIQLRKYGRLPEGFDSRKTNEILDAFEKWKEK